MGLITTRRVELPPPAVFAALDQPASSLWGYLKPIRARWFLGLGVSIITVLVQLSIPQVLAWIVDRLVGAERGAGALWAGGALVVGLGLAQAGLMLVRRILLIDPSSQIENQMRMSIFDKLLRMPISFHDEWPSGQLLTRTTTDLSIVRRWLAFGLVMSISTAVMMVFGIALLARGSGLLALIYAASIPFTVAFLWRFVISYRALTRLSQQQAGDLATTVEESVQGIRVLKALGQGRNALGRFGHQADELRTTEVSRARKMGGVAAVTGVIAGITLAIALIVGLHQVAAGRLTLGELTAFFATAAILQPQVERTGMFISMYLSSKVSLERHNEIITAPGLEPVAISPAEVASAHSRDLPRQLGSAGAPQPASVDFEGVTFAYHEGAAPTLRDINLHVNPGEIVAVVGPTGCGKSTLLQLIPRLYDVGTGTIRVDGTDVCDFSLQQLRTQVSIAFEEPVLFSSSVRDNVLVGVDTEALGPKAAERILDTALEVASAEFVAELPEGKDTLIGEEGMSLSGGQRQRLSLARAIATEPAVLLLDDPLSALDVTTEEAVVNMLKRQLANTTVVLTAHRPSTVTLADRVVLMGTHGTIAAVGTHAELLAHPDYLSLMSLTEGGQR